MKKKVKKELREKTKEELKTVLADAQKELLIKRLDFSQMKLKNTSLLAQKRKEIAVIKTFLNQK